MKSTGMSVALRCRLSPWAGARINAAPGGFGLIARMGRAT